MFEKPAGGAVQSRPAGHLALAHLAYPLPPQQGFNNLGTDRYASDLLDFTARYRLAISDDRQGFQQGARITQRPLLRKARDPFAIFFPGLKPIAMIDLF